MQTTQAIRLLVGLGNPGAEYEQTRHNAGFWWADAAAERLGVRLAPERAYQGKVARFNRKDAEPLWLLQPYTYMNLSGRSVAALARFYKILPEEILVVHDELDLQPGDAKLKQGGGHAGHNGLKDIHAQLGSPNYWRLRLGIGHPGDRRAVSDYVLGKPRLEELKCIEDAMARSLSVLDALLARDMTVAMRTIHVKTPPPRPV